MQTNTMAQLEKRPCLQVNAAAHHALALVQQNQQHPAHVSVGQAGEVISQTHHRGAHVSAGSVHVSATQTSVQQQQQQFPHVLGDQTVGFGPPQQQQLLQQVAVVRTGMGGIRRAGEMIAQVQPHQQQSLPQVAVGQTGIVSVLQAGEMIVQAQPHQQQPLPQVTGGGAATTAASTSCGWSPRDIRVCQKSHNGYMKNGYLLDP